MSDAEQANAPVTFRKVTKRRIEVRKREEPEIAEKEPKESGDESNEDEQSDSSADAKVIRPTKQTYMNSKRARKNPLSATVSNLLVELGFKFIVLNLLPI